MSLTLRLMSLAFTWTILAGAQSDQTPARQPLAAPIAIERTQSATSVSIELRGGKLFIDAAANDATRRFIFDTGSPTMISRELAETLELEIVGRNTGVDAHGAEVTMDIAIIDRLSIGTVMFRHVPVLVFDFSDLALGGCIIDGGVIGSEIFPGSAWRIDLGEERLTIAESTAALGEAAPPMLDAQLHDFGYPHAPIVDYELGGIADRALFDTGSAEDAALFAPLLDESAVADSVVAGSLRTGRGSEGESAGGPGVVGDLVRLELSDLTIDGQSLGPVNAASRAIPPTLLGAGLLARYIATLDYPGGRFLLEERSDPSPSRTHPGFGISFQGDTARVVQLFEDSPAAVADLRLDDEVVAIDGRSLAVTPENDRCSSARWLIETFEPSRAAEIVVLRDGERRTVRLPVGDGRAH